MSMIKTHNTGFFKYNTNSDQEEKDAEELAQLICDKSICGTVDSGSGLYDSFIDLTSGSYREMADWEELCSNLINLLANTHPTAVKHVINLPDAQGKLVKLKDFFSMVIGSPNIKHYMYYRALVLHPGCVDVQFIALNYYRSISGKADYGDINTPLKHILELIQTVET